MLRMRPKNIQYALIAILSLCLSLVMESKAQDHTVHSQYGACTIIGNTKCGHKEDTPFAMHSVVKLPQALYVADYLRRNGLTLDDSVLVCKDSLDADTWSPMLATFNKTRHFSYAELLRWSLAASDNNACDLLFAHCGMPTEVENYIHALGFDQIHVRLTEKEMRHKPMRAIENSSTPRAMAGLLEWLYRHRLDNENISFVWNIMTGCNTGMKRIAAVMPRGCRLVHKTGSGFRSSDGRQDRNDVGIIIFPDGSHVSIAVFVQESGEEKDVAEVAQQCLMHAQADNFLRNMPPDLQHRQTSAILKAIDGDSNDLMAVRNLRNVQPKYSDNVETRMITDNMRIYEPKDSHDRRLPVMLYLHGGGWTFGSINSCGRFCNAVAASGAVRVVALDYRLSPEHPYPAGLNDCISAVKYIMAHADELLIDASHITLGGDSSGGNLALATALSEECRDKIESLLLFYPVTKAFDDGSPSRQLYGKGYGLDAEIMDAFNSAYTINADARSADISVGLCNDADLHTLPRTLIVAAERDILCDQGRALAERMGNGARRIEYKGTVHLFITVPGQDIAFEKAVKDAVSFIVRK